MPQATALHEGEVIVTVGRYKSKCANFKIGSTKFSMPIFSIKMYIARKNKDGKLKWWLQNYYGDIVSGRAPSNRLLKKAKSIAENYNFRFFDNIRHLDLAE